MGRDLFLDFARNQSWQFIGSAVDLYHLSRAAETTMPLPGNRSQRLATAAVIQAVVALEATVNALGHDFLFDESQPQYIQPNASDVPMHLLRQAWPRSLTLVEKLRFVLSRFSEPLEAAVASRLSELLTYRNWLAHGYIYRTQLLLEYLDDKEIVMHEHDRDDSVKWAVRFPNLKFSSLDAVAPKDAEASLRVMLEVLASIARSCGRAFEILYFAGDKARVYHERGTGAFEEVIAGTSAELTGA
jgi:hypothetical protein